MHKVRFLGIFFLRAQINNFYTRKELRRHASTSTLERFTSPSVPSCSYPALGSLAGRTQNTVFKSHIFVIRRRRRRRRRLLVRRRIGETPYDISLFVWFPSMIPSLHLSMLKLKGAVFDYSHDDVDVDVDS